MSEGTGLGKFQKLDPRVKAAWLKALRSGEYKQTTQVLHDDDSFCCLGVLSDLYTEEHPDVQWKLVDMGRMEILNFIAQLPYEVMSWACADQIPIMELRALGGSFKVPADVARRHTPALAYWNYPQRGPSVSLDMLNDNGATFEEIANIIEEAL